MADLLLGVRGAKHVKPLTERLAEGAYEFFFLHRLGQELGGPCLENLKRFCPWILRLSLRRHAVAMSTRSEFSAGSVSRKGSGLAPIVGARQPAHVGPPIAFLQPEKDIHGHAGGGTLGDSSCQKEGC